MTILSSLAITELLMVLTVLTFAIVIPLLALIDILKNDFEGTNKLVWVLIVVFVNILGAILYFTIGWKQKISKE